MITFRGSGSRPCDGITRRDVLRISGLGAFGATLGLPVSTSLAGTRVGSFGQAKSCIVLFLVGGPAQHSTWDPKPDAPAEVRGEFGPIATRVPGISVSSLL